MRWAGATLSCSVQASHSSGARALEDVSVLTQGLWIVPDLGCIHCLWSHQQFVVFDEGSNLNLGGEGFLFMCLMACFSSFQSLSHVRLFATSWTAAHQACLSITNSWSLPKLISIESVMPSNYLILCPLLLKPSIFSSIRVFSNESALCIRWRKYRSFSFSISPFSEHPGLISLQSKGLSRVFSNTTVQKHQFLGAQLSL